MVNYKQLYARKKACEKQLKAVCPTLTHNSGIYMLTREENGIQFAYVGQAVNILDRLISHLMGYEQHIDRSLKKHKFYSQENINGWSIDFVECDKSELDSMEREYIKLYAQSHQMLNKTLGGQDKGKVGTGDNKQAKGYREGVRVGRKQLAKELKHIIDLHLQVTTKTDKIPDEKALDKFWFLILKELEEEDAKN